MCSIHILIISTRESITETVDSVLPQLSGEDKITVVFDGTKPLKLDKKVNVIKENMKHGFWGHPLRNKYMNTLDGDYIHHMDDDDIYVPDAIKYMREELGKYDVICFNYFDEKLKKSLKLYENNYSPLIRTQQAVLRNTNNIQAKFKNYYGGDCSFWRDLLEENITIKYTNKVILEKY